MARLRSGMVKRRSSAEGSTVSVSLSPNSFSSSARGFGIHRRPVEFGLLDLEATFGSRLDGLRLVDLVRHEVAVADGGLELVREGGRVHLEEAQGVAHEGLVLVVAGCRRVGHARRRRQADLHAVEVLAARRSTGRRCCGGIRR